MGGIKEFLKHEASGGILLMIATVAALLMPKHVFERFLQRVFKDQIYRELRRIRAKQAANLVGKRRVDGGIFLSHRT